MMRKFLKRQSPRQSAVDIADEETRCRCKVDEAPSRNLIDSLNPIDVLPPDLITTVWDFVGVGRYRFVAGANTSFRDSYTDYCQQKLESGNEGHMPVPDKKNQKRPTVKRTSPSCIVDSMQCLQLYLDDNQRELPSERDRILLRPSTPKNGGSNDAWVIRWYDSILHDAIHLAALHGKIEILKETLPEVIAFDRHRLRFPSSLCKLAAFGGHLETLQWIRAQGCPWDEWVSLYAVSNGHFELLQWARRNGCSLFGWTASAAAEQGHFEILKWAHDNNCPWDEGTCINAAKTGRFDILQWAYHNGCPMDTKTCSAAAGAGHLHILKWIRAQGCAWDEQTCMLAAEKGHLDVLQWARDHGCPWDKWTCNVAASSQGQ